MRNWPGSPHVLLWVALVRIGIVVVLIGLVPLMLGVMTNDTLLSNIGFLGVFGGASICACAWVVKLEDQENQ